MDYFLNFITTETISFLLAFGVFPENFVSKHVGTYYTHVSTRLSTTYRLVGSYSHKVILD